MADRRSVLEVSLPSQAVTDSEPTARELIDAVLRPSATPMTAVDVLAAAAATGVDPLDYCSCRFGIPETTVLERAAGWAGLRFCCRLPRLAVDAAVLQRPDALASIRVLRAENDGGDRFFLAPEGDELVMLRRRIGERPELAEELRIVPRSAIRAALTEACAGMLLDESRQRLTRRWPRSTAHLELEPHIRGGLVAGLAAVIAAATAAPFVLRELLLPFIGLLLGTPAAIRILAAMYEPLGPRRPRLLSDSELPVYTVLVPLRNEAAMVPQLGRAMAALDYPPEKLEVLFVVEERSAETVAAVERLRGDLRFSLVVVPDAPPRTKPKALNFALPLVQGQHLVVYDAEDIPHPGQLRLAASVFADDPRAECLQAELVVENGAENWLTALFAGEYAGLFGLLLPLLADLGLPMPLGGTSNHFRTARLLQLGGWDAFNVTEDADLGLRLARLRRRSLTIDSETAEEAPLTVGAWMAQRTRWMKGWMQTFIVHNRRAGELLADTGWRGFLFFELFVGGMITASLLHTVFLATLLLRLALGYGLALDDPWNLFCLALLAAGYGGALALVLAGLVRRREWRLLPYQLLLPLYWVLHSLAAARAAHELMKRPYFWGKTEHGKTRLPRRIRPNNDGYRRP